MSVGILLSNFFLLPYLPSSITKNQQYVFFSCYLTFFVQYIWSKQHPNRDVILFGVHMAAAYLPYAYLVLGYAFNNGQVLPLDMLHGMLVGHVYYYGLCRSKSVAWEGGDCHSIMAGQYLLLDGGPQIWLWRCIIQ